MIENFAEKITSITTCALKKKDLHGIVGVLKKISEETDSCGCVLWETDPWASLAGDHPSGNLHVFARWMCDEITMPLKELPINNSANGRAIITQRTVTVDDVRYDSGTYKGSDWIFDVTMTSICAVPIKFDSNDYNAALCVYRRNEVRPFDSEDQTFIRQIATLIPRLYQSVRNHVGHDLLSGINKILEEAESKAKAKEIQQMVFAQVDAPGKEQAEDVEFKEVIDGLEKICLKVAEIFQCIETSLFLQNRLQTGNKFELLATNYKNWTAFKKSYEPEKDQDHLTGWVLKNQRAVNIFDLGNFERDKSKLREQYPDIDWKDSVNIKQAAGDILGYNKADLPTLSFMAVPIKKGDELLGVIRCCTARKDPWFFADRQVKLLELVASQISRFWSEWLQHLEEKKEITRWEKFIKDFSQLNAKAQMRLGRSEDDKIELYVELIRLAESSIKNSSILEIRLRDEKTNQLYYAKQPPSVKLKRSKEETERQNKRFSLDKSSYYILPLGVMVYEKKEAMCFTRGETEDYHSEMLPESKQLLIAPIGVQKDVRGVLDIHSNTDTPFPPYVFQMATLLGQQIGLYLSLWESEKMQRQVLEDLSHQLKSPVRHVLKRANDLLQEVEQPAYTESDETAEFAQFVKNNLLPLRGVSRKANRVAVNASIFKDLASEGKIKIASDKKVILRDDELFKMLVEAGRDTKLLLNEDETVQFRVNKDSFKLLSNFFVKVKFDLLEQSINCLFDNAGKYSMTGTQVETKGGFEPHKGGRYFYISVKNQGCNTLEGEGFRISEDEINDLKKRYYRGKWAGHTTGEGSGIGLWIVDKIMAAHGGKLEIFETDDNGCNVVRLLFPVSG